MFHSYIKLPQAAIPQYFVPLRFRLSTQYSAMMAVYVEAEIVDNTE